MHSRCKICGRSGCASWMHSIEEQEEHEELRQMDDAQLRDLVKDLRHEVKGLQEELDHFVGANKMIVEEES
jgi:hypothetical protein